MIEKNRVRPRKVFIVAYAFPPMGAAGTYRTLRFCRYLPENGWEPHVLTIREAPDLNNDHKLLDRLPGNVKIYRTRIIDFWRMWRNCLGWKRSRWLKSVRANPIQPNHLEKANGTKKRFSRAKTLAWELVTIPDHVVFWLPFALLKGFRILRKEKCDILFTTSPPHSEHFVGFILSRLFRKPWVADFRDPMLDSSGYAPPTLLRRKVDQSLEKLIVKSASKILIISDHYRRIISERSPIHIEKFITMPNGYDPDVFDNVTAKNFSKFTIVHAGSFYAKRSPRFFLRALSKWVNTRKGIRENLQVLFYGPESPEALQVVSQEKLESVVHFRGIIPQDELIPILKGAHLLLLIIGFDPESKGTVTGKVFDYMACERPILAIIPEGDAYEILKVYGKIHCVLDENEGTLIRSLDDAYKEYLRDPEFRATVPTSRRQSARSQFDARLQTHELSSILNRSISSSMR